MLRISHVPQRKMAAPSKIFDYSPKFFATFCIHSNGMWECNVTELGDDGSELVMGKFFKTQPNPTENFWTQPNPTHKSLHSTQPTQPNPSSTLGMTRTTTSWQCTPASARGPAPGPRPASSCPATTQTPEFDDCSTESARFQPQMN